MSNPTPTPTDAERAAAREITRTFVKTQQPESTTRAQAEHVASILARHRSARVDELERARRCWSCGASIARAIPAESLACNNCQEPHDALVQLGATVERLEDENTQLKNWKPSFAVENQLRATVSAQAAEIARLEAAKDGAYEERNRVVAALCKVFPSVRTRTAIEGWSEDWHGCVYVQLPTGQASWHYHDSHAHLFSFLPERDVEWDGHTTPEKYERLAALTPTEEPSDG